MNVNMLLPDYNQSYPEGFVTPAKIFFDLRTQRPYSKSYPNTLYDSLFCDDARYYRSEESVAISPWDLLLDDACADNRLNDVLLDNTAQSRPRILASELLAKRGILSIEKQFLAVIIEIRQRNGLDVLAVYADGSARYINHSEEVMIWESKTPEYLDLFDRLSKKALQLVSANPFSFTPRSAHPGMGKVKVNLISTHGRHVSEYEQRGLRREFLKGGLIECCLRIMIYLGSQKNKRQRHTTRNFFT